MGRAKMNCFFKNSIWVCFVPEESGGEKNGQLLGICTSNKEATRLADITDEILVYFDRILNENPNQSKISVSIKPG